MDGQIGREKFFSFFVAKDVPIFFIQQKKVHNSGTLGPVIVSLLEGWPHFRGEFVLKSMLWDFSKWPEYRGGNISGVRFHCTCMYLFYSYQHSHHRSINWNYCVLDEGHVIKNTKTKVILK